MARNFCQAAGGRLCTAVELRADETHGSGCNADFERVWSDTPAGARRKATARIPAAQAERGAELRALAAEAQSHDSTTRSSEYRAYRDRRSPVVHDLIS